MGSKKQVVDQLDLLSVSRGPRGALNTDSCMPHDSGRKGGYRAYGRKASVYDRVIHKIDSERYYSDRIMFLVDYGPHKCGEVIFLESEKAHVLIQHKIAAMCEYQPRRGKRRK